MRPLPPTQRAVALLTYRRALVQGLVDLGARWVLHEPNYFDRDYLSEFAAFYATSTREYGNRCSRVHFFSSEELTLDDFHAAARGDAGLQARLQQENLGFSVLRPIPSAPLGCTVLRWYPDTEKDLTPRVTSGAGRTYRVHLPGLELVVESVAWQQQDTGVGGCATVALWTMFHSSALDWAAAVPTTAEITRLAQPIRRRASGSGSSQQRTGSSCGRSWARSRRPGSRRCSSRATWAWASGSSLKVFTTLAALLLRAGYPVLSLCSFWDGGDRHVVCVVGFCACPDPAPGVNGSLATILSDSPATVGSVRLALWEEVLLMSLRLGLVRVLLRDRPLVDVLYDTTDSDRNLAPFCYIVFYPNVETVLEELMEKGDLDAALLVLGH